MVGWIFDAPTGLKDFRNPLDWHAAMLKEAKDIITILVGASLGKNPEEVTPRGARLTSRDVRIVQG